MCSARAARRDSPQLFVTGQSINSARVMNEITNCCPETASRHACRSEWFFGSERESVKCPIWRGLERLRPAAGRRLARQSLFSEAQIQRWRPVLWGRTFHASRRSWKESSHPIDSSWVGIPARLIAGTLGGIGIPHRAPWLGRSVPTKAAGIPWLPNGENPSIPRRLKNPECCHLTRSLSPEKLRPGRPSLAPQSTRTKPFKPEPNERTSLYSFLRRARECCPTSPLDRAIRFLYLNRTAFGGMYRLNQQGAFNVPFGGGERTTAPLWEYNLLTSRS